MLYPICYFCLLCQERKNEILTETKPYNACYGNWRNSVRYVCGVIMKKNKKNSKKDNMIIDRSKSLFNMWQNYYYFLFTFFPSIGFHSTIFWIILFRDKNRIWCDTNSIRLWKFSFDLFQIIFSRIFQLLIIRTHIHTIKTISRAKSSQEKRSDTPLWLTDWLID